MKTSRENKPMHKSSADYAEWKTNDDALRVKAKALNAEKVMKERKHKSLNDYDKLGKVPGNDDQTSLEVKSAVKSIDVKKKKLDDLIDKVDSIISKIPGAIPPNSTVFGPTAKKPGKNNTIDDDITDSMDKGELHNSVSSFKKSNDIFMKKNFSRGKKLSEYRRELKTGLNSIIKKEPFPTYSKIRMTNPGFITYCRNVILTGSRSFGIPGQPPQ
jgi:Ni/Co efflux regulator RcnB